MHVIHDSVLALCQSVPELDGLVTAARHNLTIVTGECHAVHILGVALEGSDGRASVQVPEAHGLVPGSRQGVLAIGRQHSTGNALTVAMQGTARCRNACSLFFQRSG